VSAWWIVSTIAYPVCLLGYLVCGSSPFAMIINLLIWADARGSCGQQGTGDSAT